MWSETCVTCIKAAHVCCAKSVPAEWAARRLYSLVETHSERAGVRLQRGGAEVRKSSVSVSSALPDKALRSGWVLPSPSCFWGKSFRWLHLLTLTLICCCSFCKRENSLCSSFSCNQVEHSKLSCWHDDGYAEWQRELHKTTHWQIKCVETIFTCKCHKSLHRNCKLHTQLNKDWIWDFLSNVVQ